MLFARTVREELLFGPRTSARPRHVRRADADALDASLDPLEDILERPPLTLSFGQQKRLALAIALSLRPRTLILDEPSAGQDHGSATRSWPRSWPSPASRASTSSPTMWTLH